MFLHSLLAQYAYNGSSAGSDVGKIEYTSTDKMVLSAGTVTMGGGNVQIPSDIGAPTAAGYILKSSDTNGNLEWGTVAASTIDITANNTNDETVYLTFVDGATGDQGLETDTGLSYNPSTGELTSISFNGDLTGNAATATILETTRTIGGVDFNGSANIDLPGVNTAGNQDTTGNAATATILETARTIGGVSFNGSANIDLPGVNTQGNQDTTGNAATATILETARTIGGVSFNGSANIDLPGVNTQGNQNTTGSAATLTTARTIGGVEFDGSANIDLPGVNTAGNQDTSGNAATATKIASIENSNIVQLTATQTLTNKTLTSPILTTPDLGTPSAGVNQLHWNCKWFNNR